MCDGHTVHEASYIIHAQQLVQPSLAIAIEVPPHGIAIDQQGVCYLCYRPTLAKQYGQYGSGRHCAYRTLRIL
jgi:hypothetical protein